MKEYVLKIVDSIITLVCIVIFLFAAIVIVSVMKTPAGEPPMIFGRTMLQVISPSMEPTLRIGTVVMVKSVDVSQIQEGDIISFYSRDPDIYDEVVTHRVDEIRNKNGDITIYTKGDANPSRDNVSVKSSQIIGKVTGVSNVIGSFVMLLSYKWVVAVLIIVPMGYIVISNGIKLAKSLKNEDPKGDNEDKEE